MVNVWILTLLPKICTMIVSKTALGDSYQNTKYKNWRTFKPLKVPQLVSDLMAVGCDLNGAHYENGETFQPSPLYKCMCIAGAIGCTPAFFQSPAGLLGPTPLMGSRPAGLQTPKKHQQDTTYKSGVCLESELVEKDRVPWMLLFENEQDGDDRRRYCG